MIVVVKREERPRRPEDGCAVWCCSRWLEEALSLVCSDLVAAPRHGDCSWCWSVLR